MPVLTRRDILPFDLAPHDALGHIFGVALPAFIVVAAISGKSGVQDLARRRGLVPRCVLWRARRIGVVCQRALWSCAANALMEKWELLLTVVLPKLLLLIVSFNLAEEVGGYLGQLYLHLAAPKGSQG